MIHSRKGELVSEVCAQLIYICVDRKPVPDEQAVSSLLSQVLLFVLRPCFLPLQIFEC